MESEARVAFRTLAELEPLASELPDVEERARMPAGFRAGASVAGIKSSGRADLGVLATTAGPACVAATFTTNRVLAAPVRLSRAHLDATGGRTVAVLSTSGCANAATGSPGDEDQATLALALAERLGVATEDTIAISTGLIGSRLPVDAIRRSLADLVPGGLAESDDALAALAEQMTTTDSRPKAASVQVALSEGAGAAGGTNAAGGAVAAGAVAATGETRPVTVAGIAKGVGMIHPQMATMLALVMTDAPVEPGTLRAILGPVVERTWNQLSVDGDTSTNDTVLLLASGAVGGPAVERGTEDFAVLARAIEAVARSLTRQQAADGEGATTLVTCQVSGALNPVDARAVARSVVGSSLVKAAIHGRDPNWGRIAAAVGNARVGSDVVPVETDRLAIAIAGHTVFAGLPVDFDRPAVAARMDAPEVLIRVELGLGDATGEAFGCDLTEQYVIENSAYST